MKVFRLMHHENNQDVFRTRYSGSLGDTKDVVRNDVPKHLREDVVVDEVEVNTSKLGVIAMLNGEPQFFEPSRTFGITPRGGLKEIAE